MAYVECTGAVNVDFDFLYCTGGTLLVNDPETLEGNAYNCSIPHYFDESEPAYMCESAEGWESGFGTLPNKPANDK